MEREILKHLKEIFILLQSQPIKGFDQIFYSEHLYRAMIQVSISVKDRELEDELSELWSKERNRIGQYIVDNEKAFHDETVSLFSHGLLESPDKGEAFYQKRLSDLDHIFFVKKYMLKKRGEEYDKEMYTD